MKPKFAVLFILFVSLIYSCSQSPPITPETAADCPFYYKDDKVIIAIGFPTATGINTNWFEFFIQNIDTKPLRMNCVYDVMQFKLNGVTYQPRRYTPPTAYPGILNPGMYFRTFYIPDDKSLNTLETEMIFYQHQDTTYTIKRK